MNKTTETPWLTVGRVKRCVNKSYFVIAPNLTERPVGREVIDGKLAGMAVVHVPHKKGDVLKDGTVLDQTSQVTLIDDIDADGLKLCVYHSFREMLFKMKGNITVTPLIGPGQVKTKDGVPISVRPDDTYVSLTMLYGVRK